MTFFVSMLIAGLTTFLFRLHRTLQRGIKKQLAEDKAFKAPQLETQHAVERLTITPLVEFYAEEKALQTEAGVSYLIEADGTKILLDVGANEKRSHPSPLLANAQKMGVDLSELDALFLSHLHRDHVGGVRQEREKTFSPSNGPHPWKELPVYSPAPLTGTLPIGSSPITVTEPMEIAPGIWSMGPMGRQLFFMGYTQEQILAVHVKKKGMVLIVGCGHPGIERIIERCKALFPHPIFGIIGGLHYPITDGRIMVGPLNVQKLVGTDRMPWRGLSKADVEERILAIEKANVQKVGISPHDSCDWSLKAFKKAFQEGYCPVRVGRPIEF